MRVVKLGGSLLGNDSLNACLKKLANNPTSSLIVPGGGVFAEQVRLAQLQWQFNDVAAHHMAILAMQQMALLINALQPAWPLVQTWADLHSWPAQNRTGVWFPDIMILNQQAIPASWKVTSDSLAAWLADVTGAEKLVLVKAAPVLTSATLADYSRQGIVDAAFLEYVNPVRYTTTVISSSDFILNTATPHQP